MGIVQHCQKWMAESSQQRWAFYWAILENEFNVFLQIKIVQSQGNIDSYQSGCHLLKITLTLNNRTEQQQKPERKDES